MRRIGFGSGEMSVTGRSKVLIVCASALAILSSTPSGAASDATAGEPSRLGEWIADHPDLFFGRQGLQRDEKTHLWISYFVLGSVLTTLELAVEPPHDAYWDGENAFDEGIRSGLKGRSRSSRAAADTASDVLLMGVLPLALAADTILLREEYPILKRLLFDMSWLITNELVTRTAKVSAGRERPYVDPCSGDPDYVKSCGGRDGSASFFSGHASTSATMAGLMCSRHLNRTASDFYDWLVCGGVAATSAATGLLRISAESHNATDVLAGWASGAVFGYLLPSYFQAKYDSGETAQPAASVEPLASPRLLGLRMSFAF